MIVIIWSSMRLLSLLVACWHRQDFGRLKHKMLETR